jgi:hypothetical protein
MARAICLALILALALPVGAQTPAGVTDPDVLKGIGQVGDADYDGAILTLDTAVRRLATDPKRVQDLSQAYLYLGIAYMGKGHEAAARVNFREAVQQIKNISLSPDRFPPKVIDALEAAREEVRQSSAATTPPTKATPVKKHGGSKTILIVGGVAAVGGGVALAAGGGGSNVPPTPVDPRKVDTFTGTVAAYDYRRFDIVVSASGTLNADATWTNAQFFFELILTDDQDETISRSNRITNTSANLSAQVSPRTSSPSAAYHLYIHNPCDCAAENFNLTVRHP